MAQFMKGPQFSEGEIHTPHEAGTRIPGATIFDHSTDPEVW